MANDNNINPVSFFPDSRSQRTSEKKNKAEFDKSLSSAVNSKTRPLNNAKSLALKADRPKVMNRDPFFPKTPMPYHPEATQPPVPAAVQSNVLSVNSMKNSPDLDSVEEINSAETPGFENRKLGGVISQGPGDVSEHPSIGTGPTPMSEASTEGSTVASGETPSRAVPTDDRRGVMNESYERSAVSYPVSRIAQESLDDETQNSLKEKGFWEVPTMYGALPTQKTLAMAESVEKGSQAKEKVPVQKPVAQFMASLENELGVSPDRLVSAFQSLPPGTLSQSPQATMVEVVKQLDLRGEDESKALSLYSKMLQQMDILGKGEQVPFSAAGLAGVAAVAPQAAAAKYSQNALLGEVADRPVISEHAKEFFPKALKEVTEGNGINAETMTIPHSSSPANSPIKALNLESKEGERIVSTGQQAQAGLTTGVLAKQAVMPKIQDDMKFQGKPNNALKLETLSGKNHVTESAVNNLGYNGQSVQSSQIDNSARALGGLGAGASLEGASQSQGANAKHEAIQSIVQNAQLLASKGGGEMHMTLKPEHLGEIHMHVAMNGQKVDVQLTTEHNEVKKLIEQSVHELKHGLASHNLNMEKLNVSLNNKGAENNFQQSQKDFGAARDFSQAFHEQNQARREMTELNIPGTSSLNKNLSRGENASARMTTNQVGRSSGRLNIVA